ncbi:TniQ family protein [Streptomyces sp. NPDC047082]|uniref:TniQ family protein n=1 Tax=Streptomyces sp. NPDC047082 TaxID=3155259 RepID=UPI0033EF6B98
MTAPYTAAPVPPPASAPADAPRPAPGALRLRPLPGEVTASYLARLASAYRMPLTHLLDGLGIRLSPGPDTRPPGSELTLTATAQQYLAAFTRIPHPHLRRALPCLSPTDRPHTSDPTGETATALWQHTPPALQPVRACTVCVKHRTPDAIATTAWIYPQPPQVLLCIRHQQASSDPRHTTPLGIRTLPEVAHTHRRLARAVSAAPALTWAATITTRWYDHQQHLATRWQTRLAALTAAYPHTCDGPASPTLTCRSLVTYPETLTLAQALAASPTAP